MTADPVYFAFPACAFAAGAFMVIRGLSKLHRPPKLIKGTAKPRAGGIISLEGLKCVYQRIVLERESMGKWEEIARAESRAPFYVGKTIIEPEFADFSLRPRTFEGKIRRDLGVLEQFIDTAVVASTNPGRLAAGAKKQEEGEFLQDALVSSLRSLKPLKAPLERSARSRIRVSEYAIPEGTVLHVGGGDGSGGSLVGTLESRLTITDSGESSALDSHRERAVLGMIAGAFLLSLSFVLSYLLLSSV